jgi:phospholipid/cholesterol/gamma-HCH transport system substrate-binding protein
LKYSKEIKAGFIAVLAIVIIVLGVNFLKGNSFFGGDDTYYSYMENSGQLMVASNVTLNGVVVGKVLAVEYVPNRPLKKRVKITFSIQNSSVVFPKGTIIEIGSLDLLSKGLLIQIPSNSSVAYYKPGSVLPGRLSVDMVSQVKAYADPISQKLQAMMASIDKMVGSLSTFWDESATSEIEASLKEVKIAIARFGDLAKEMQDFVGEEKLQFARIMSNVENITLNLRKSNEQISSIIGNLKIVSDDLVTADFKSVILEAQTTLKKINYILAETNAGKGTLGKLVHDEKLYNELVESNKQLQELVDDIKKHPERYINISVFGGKSKGIKLNSTQEKKLTLLLDSLPE